MIGYRKDIYLATFVHLSLSGYTLSYLTDDCFLVTEALG